jgi:hypothetical protein
MEKIALLRNFHSNDSSSNKIRMMKWRRVRWAGLVADMEKRNA